MLTCCRRNVMFLYRYFLFQNVSQNLSSLKCVLVKLFTVEEKVKKLSSRAHIVNIGFHVLDGRERNEQKELKFALQSVQKDYVNLWRSCYRLGIVVVYGRVISLFVETTTLRSLLYLSCSLAAQRPACSVNKRSLNVSLYLLIAQRHKWILRKILLIVKLYA